MYGEFLIDFSELDLILAMALTLTEMSTNMDGQEMT